MTDPTRSRLEAELAAAEAEVLRLRTANAALAETFRQEPSDERKEELKRAATSLATARDHVEAAKGALTVFEATGSPYGIVAAAGAVTGTIAVAVPPGTSQEERGRRIDEALSDRLSELAAELGVVLAAAPSRFVRERPGRDAEARTVFDVGGRVEGDRLMPAVSRAARGRR